VTQEEHGVNETDFFGIRKASSTSIEYGQTSIKNNSDIKDSRSNSMVYPLGCLMKRDSSPPGLSGTSFDWKETQEVVCQKVGDQILDQTPP